MNQMTPTIEGESIAEPPAPPISRTWRCFHCDQVFTAENAAAEHFGLDQNREPGCIEKVDGGELGLLRRVRELEEQLVPYLSETSGVELYVQGLKAERETAIRRAEEAGYAKGLADAQDEVGKVLQSLREKGWIVASHTEARGTRGSIITWIMADGNRAVRAQGRTDAEAIAAVAIKIDSLIDDETGGRLAATQMAMRLTNYRIKILVKAINSRDAPPWEGLGGQNLRNARDAVALMRGHGLFDERDCVTDFGRAVYREVVEARGKKL